MATIPGLDQYLEFLASSESTNQAATAEAGGAMAVATPRIDALLDAFKHRAAVSSSQDTTSSGVQPEAVSSSQEQVSSYCKP